MKSSDPDIIPLVDLRKQYRSIKGKIDRNISRVIRESDFILGRQVSQFEKEFAKFLGVKYAVGVSSGTDAIHLALKALDPAPGMEAILPSHTFTATAEPLVWMGIKPVFVDIDEKTFTIDPLEIKKAISPKTRIIIPVHLYGRSARMDEILKIAREFKLDILEDAAQAHGARFQNKMVGGIGKIGIFSFYPGKNLGAYGDAGMVVTDDQMIAGRIVKLRNHGRVQKYEHDLIGFGNRMDTIQAAVLSAKLPHLTRWNKKRAEVAGIYNKLLSDVKQIIIPAPAPVNSHVYHLYVIRCKSRDGLKNHLLKQGIQTGIHYPLPLHLQAAYRFLGYRKGDLPVTEKTAAQILSLPIYPEISGRQVKFICKCIKDFYS